MHAGQRTHELLFIIRGSAQQHLQEAVNRGQRSPELMGGIGCKTAHLLLGFTFISKRDLKPLQHSIK
ncbi:hypothetical protein D3C75_665170 [compost metagenome]